jgi:hypothetical protein
MNIPKSWDEITIGKWRELNSIQSETELGRLIQQVSILADVDSETIRNLPVDEFRELTKQLDFVSNDIPKEVKTTFKLRGVEYGIIPDLNFISLGEFMDAETWKNNTTENIHLLCAMLYRPIISWDDDEWEIEQYKQKGFMKRANLFLNELPITVPYGAVLFFSLLGMEFIEIMGDYLTEEGI